MLTLCASNQFVKEFNLTKIVIDKELKTKRIAQQNDFKRIYCVNKIQFKTKEINGVPILAY